MEHDEQELSPCSACTRAATEMAVPQHKHGGPPPRYCENEDHNAAQHLRRP